MTVHKGFAIALAIAVSIAVGSLIAQPAQPESAAGCPQGCQILIAKQRDRIDALQKQVTALSTRFDGLQAQVKTIEAKVPTRVVFGPEQFLDYQKLDHSFNHKCPDGSVAVGWGYGHINKDASFFCRSVSVGK